MQEATVDCRRLTEYDLLYTVEGLNSTAGPRKLFATRLTVSSKDGAIVGWLKGNSTEKQWVAETIALTAIVCRLTGSQSRPQTNKLRISKGMRSFLVSPQF